ncbi:GAF domain-containing protein [Nocardioides sp. J2M5]|uniref:sigma-54-dependent Fis family transcriptional regulator n=1 Tax=Nocardioides TaxID=1839 RepID=UPI001BAA467B|nr:MULTISPECIES: helix-turn-helix domain-containing protein [Nocardioides]MBS2937962.1 GAF domain-containing protein [Nocardioides palaemonis]
MSPADDPSAVAGSRRPRADDELVRSAKETLISLGLLHSADTQPARVSDEIDRSWRRSISAGATHTTGAFQFVNEYDEDSELSRAARPVLDRLAETLQDMGTAIFLADRSGQIVARRVAGHTEQVRFDSANAAEGFDFSEESIGTNGLGTPIQEGASVFVRGAEHFNEALESLACAGVGIRHPVTGRVIGSLSLAAPADAAEMMMLAMTREGAKQIVDNLSATVSRRELTLGRSYQRHRAKGPVIVLNSDTVMTNVTGLSFLNVEMHARLWDSLLAKDWGRGPHELELDLQSLHARVLAHRLDDTDDAAFAVEILDRKQARPTGRPSRSAPVRDAFVVNLQRTAARSASAITVTGPGGSGKWYVVREWLRTEGHESPLVLDGGALVGQDAWRGDARDALASGGVVVLRRFEDLDAGQVSAVKALADDAAPGRLVITADLDRCSESAVRILSQVAVGIDVPPLASRSQELPTIVQALLAEIDPQHRPVLSASTMQSLMRWDWPGNVAELRQVLLGLAAELPGKSVSPYHLPERMWETANRRPLTRIEAAERSEIVAALRQVDGNRSKAATLLGIGRTTLYRKLTALGIDDEALLS